MYILYQRDSLWDSQRDSQRDSLWVSERLWDSQTRRENMFYESYAVCTYGSGLSPRQALSLWESQRDSLWVSLWDGGYWSGLSPRHLEKPCSMAKAQEASASVHAVCVRGWERHALSLTLSLTLSLSLSLRRRIWERTITETFIQMCIYILHIHL